MGFIKNVFFTAVQCSFSRLFYGNSEIMLGLEDFARGSWRWELG
jgi:hypothetical protein